MINVRYIWLLLLFTGCIINPLRDITTDGLSYDGTDVYYKGEICAELSAIEIAYDDGKIVKEATFVLVDQKYNEHAIAIIKFVRERNPSMEVEVEIWTE